MTRDPLSVAWSGRACVIVVAIGFALLILQIPGNDAGLRCISGLSMVATLFFGRARDSNVKAWRR